MVMPSRAAGCGSIAPSFYSATQVARSSYSAVLDRLHDPDVDGEGHDLSTCSSVWPRRGQALVVVQTNAERAQAGADIHLVVVYIQHADFQMGQ
jgi:hypothetical protein